MIGFKTIIELMRERSVHDCLISMIQRGGETRRFFKIQSYDFACHFCSLRKITHNQQPIKYESYAFAKISHSTFINIIIICKENDSLFFLHCVVLNFEHCTE